MVRRCWKPKVWLWVSRPSPSCSLCCAFWSSLTGCARWCSNPPAVLSHKKFCEFPAISTRPCPCQMIQLSCLTSNSWLLCWIGVLQDQSQTLLLLVQMASSRQSISFHIQCCKSLLILYDTNKVIPDQIDLEQTQFSTGTWLLLSILTQILDCTLSCCYLLGQEPWGQYNCIDRKLQHRKWDWLQCDKSPPESDMQIELLQPVKTTIKKKIPISHSKMMCSFC